MAIDLGASSPNTICNTVINANAVGSAIWCASSGVIVKPKMEIILKMILVTTDSPIQPKPKEAKVIPNCVAER
jgi:hypothetical protein